MRAILDRTADLEVVGQAANGQEAVDRTAELSPEVVLMDIMMPVMDGDQASRRILSQVASAEPLTRTEAELYSLRQEWPTLRTKLYRPPVPADVVIREELLARLEAGRRRR